MSGRRRATAPARASAAGRRGRRGRRTASGARPPGARWAAAHRVPRRAVPRSVRGAAPAGAGAAVALAVLAVSCAPGQGPHVEGAAPEAADDAVPVYVPDAVGEPLLRPERFGVTESVSLASLTWDSWGGPEATATGRATGTWCLPDCPEDGYPVTVELRDTVRTERVAYYARATVAAAPDVDPDADDLPPAIADELADVTLSVPGTEKEPG